MCSSAKRSWYKLMRLCSSGRGSRPLQYCPLAHWVNALFLLCFYNCNRQRKEPRRHLPGLTLLVTRSKSDHPHTASRNWRDKTQLSHKRIESKIGVQYKRQLYTCLHKQCCVARHADQLHRLQRSVYPITRPSESGSGGTRPCIL